MIQSVLGEIAQKLAQGFLSMQNLTAGELFDLREALIPFRQSSNLGYIQFNRSVTTTPSLCKGGLYLR